MVVKSNTEKSPKLAISVLPVSLSYKGLFPPQNAYTPILATSFTPSSPLLTTEDEIRKYFADIPVLISIAECESHFTQFDPNGLPLPGVLDPDDTGAFQINKRYHLEDSVKAEMDINTLEGNMEFARSLYESQGTTPWNKSKGCWSKLENP